MWYDLQRLQPPLLFHLKTQMSNSSSDIIGHEVQGEQSEEVFLPMWPSGLVRLFCHLCPILIHLPCPQKMSYCFHNTHPGTPIHHRKVKQVIKEWEKKYTNINFNYVDSQDATIRITFHQCDPLRSLTGHDIMKAKPSDPTMNLGQINGTSEDLSNYDKNCILCGFSDSLGLEHEHDETPKPAICFGLYPRDDGAAT